MRMAAPDRLAPGFEEDMQQRVRRIGRSGLFPDAGGERARDDRMAAERTASRFDMPVYYLSAGPPRIQPVGGGRAIIERLAEAAGTAGVKVRYESAATG